MTTTPVKPDNISTKGQSTYIGIQDSIKVNGVLMSLEEAAEMLKIPLVDIIAVIEVHTTEVQILTRTLKDANECMEAYKDSLKLETPALPVPPARLGRPRGLQKQQRIHRKQNR